MTFASGRSARSSIAFSLVGLLALGACSDASDQNAGISEQEDGADGSVVYSGATPCAADSEGLYEESFDSSSFGQQFEYFQTRDWDLWGRTRDSIEKTFTAPQTSTM